MVTVAAPAKIEYPDSDGQPMSDNTLQFEWIVTLKGNLDALYQDDPQVFVAGDLLWYPVEGDNRLRAAPDTMVVFGRPKGYRGSYMQWREDNIAPQVVFEVLSPGNRHSEMIRKFRFYERHGVEEYYLLDPDHLFLDVWQRQDDELVPIEKTNDWVSPLLSIRFDVTPDELRVYKPDGSPFLTFGELSIARDRDRQRADAEAERADAEAERAERLAARLRELGETPE